MSPMPMHMQKESSAAALFDSDDDYQHTDLQNHHISNEVAAHNNFGVLPNDHV